MALNSERRKIKESNFRFDSLLTSSNKSQHFVSNDRMRNNIEFYDRKLEKNYSQI